ncbi:hypothetical protein CLU79DRAFT_764452, partial [Phycomyces nitens]
MALLYHTITNLECFSRGLGLCTDRGSKSLKINNQRYQPIDLFFPHISINSMPGFMYRILSDTTLYSTRNNTELDYLANDD